MNYYNRALEAREGNTNLKSHETMTWVSDFGSRRSRSGEQVLLLS